MRNKIALTPMDIRKETHVHCDASKEGLGWILSQMKEDSAEPKDYKAPKNIITFGSTTLKDAQKRHSPVKLELLGIVTSVTRLNYYSRGEERVRVYTDCSAMKGLFSKSISDAKNP